MHHALSHDDISAIRAALLAFYDASARPLPWRRTRDPYAVWVSEIMAQQTRVETVVPYYERWVRQFPDIATLADAALDDVLKAWEGLGYYARARNLHSAARIVREQHQGVLPASRDALRALPGIGEYTAGAVASIAYGVRCAAVDGNVRRVLARLLDDPAPSPVRLREQTAALVPPTRPGDFNQALMELGAVVCTPQAPRCGSCPLMSVCRARARGTQADRPAARIRKKIPVFDIATAVVRDAGGRLLIVRRPERGLLGGMWCFPGVEMRPDESAAAHARSVAREYTAARAHAHALGIVEHTFSHRRERYHCFLFDATEREDLLRSDVFWIEESDTEKALPRAQQRIRSIASPHLTPRQAAARSPTESAPARRPPATGVAPR